MCATFARQRLTKRALGSQNTDNQKKRILADLEEKLAKTEAKAEQYEARAHKVSQLVDRGHGLV